MKILIQEGLYREFHEARLINSLNRLDSDWYYFKHIPFANEFIFEEKFKYVEDSYLIFGSINSCRIFETKYKEFLTPGTFFNDNFNFKVYKDIWKNNLLNYDSKIKPFTSEVNNFPSFIRPCEDSKIFNARVFEDKSDWEYMRNIIIHNSPINIIEDIQISSIKKIYSEVRCFVVNRKIITASFYRLNGKHYLKECFDEDILKFAQSMVNIWSPIQNFVIDIARTDKGLKIIEIGCINCAGFYDINLPKLLNSLT